MLALGLRDGHGVELSYAFREIALIMNRLPTPTLGNHDQSVQSESVSEDVKLKVYKIMS